MLVPDFQIHGPGALAHSRILEQVAARRIRNEWGLDGPLEGVLLATADCANLNKRGWLVANGKVTRITVVDCEQTAHAGMMASRGLLADVSRERLNGERGWLILK